MRKILFTLLGAVLSVAVASAHVNPERENAPNNNNDQVSFRSNCDVAKAQRDQAVNNVRARLTTGGDVWWDGNDGRYVVPKVPPGEPEVSSIFAGAVWLGGVDAAGNLKLAAQTYGRSSGATDFWSGPLTPLNAENPGETDQETCSNWDAFFVVTGDEIDEHLRLYNESIENGTPYEASQIPSGVRGWPGRGNPYFFDVNGFELPNTAQGLAGFADQDADGLYNPLNGDFPIIEIRGCPDPQYPDEMIFWIYNDNGNVHTQSNADPIRMEIQVQAFGYATNDELNDMTFQRYKLINRALEPIDSTFFAMWVDPDLGCYTDDFIGCDTVRSLGYVYNEDALDGQTGCTCPGGVNTYCDEIPLLGVDYFRGPLAPVRFGENGELIPIEVGENPDTAIELGMSSFTYYNNGGLPGTPPGTSDPGQPIEYYRYLTGHWRDGTPFTYGGEAYQDGTEPIDYAYTEAPDDVDGWSMCTANVTLGQDRRTIQASGPFLLSPGAVNELIIGVVWVADQPYPCPSIRQLQQADDIAQALFDNCFDIVDGPDAPDIDIIELDEELILVLTNDEVQSNNAFEAYAERGLEIPETVEDSLYVFEGYKIYQVAGPNVGLTPENVNNPSLVRLIAQVDITNGVDRLFNWVSVDNPTGEPYYVPELQVEGRNRGIQHTFRVTEDAFAEGARSLINHKQYYFVAVAYAYNEYEPFDPETVLGQPEPYLEGRGNIGPNGDGLPYTAIPRPIIYQDLNAAYGDGAIITRIDGVGAGRNFLDLSEETHAGMEEAFADGESYKENLVYAPGAGPIEILIYNPLDVVDGEFEIEFMDSNMDDETLEDDARWVLRNLGDGTEIMSARTIEVLNEQIIAEFGFSVNIGQVAEPGEQETEENGYIGFDIEYERGNAANPWVAYIPENFDLTGGQAGFGNSQLFDYMSTADGERDAAIDPDGGLTQFGEAPLMPYYLLDWTARGEFQLPFISPVWANNSGSGIVRNQMDLEDLNNVDIVFTPNKDLWSRCVVIETANRFYTESGFTTQGNVNQFDLRAAPSVGKEAGPDGLPIPDEDGNGMGWFPGYAIDVETGQRLNIFFGENSVYRPDNPLLADTAVTFTDGNNGADMMFNPSSQIVIPEVANLGLLPVYAGGQHMIYVTKTPYDSCASFRDNFEPSPLPLSKVRSVREITWAGLMIGNNDFPFTNYQQGLIPGGEEVRVKLRVTNPYQVEVDVDNIDGDQRTGTGENNYHPKYQFSIEGAAPTELDEEGIADALEDILVVPNPYYGFSDYETSQFTTTVKITNLPEKCVVTIYTLEGKFIRQYNRDEIGTIPEGGNRAVERNQVTPALEWDLNNSKGIPVASGVYLIHVAAEGLGERTIKWFGVNRQFDPSGL
ncbi:MAG: hypothetical protein ACE362_24790 [Phaeodactylibacter xiamenensis]|nr:hypothetical protein [Phaeodactylibacter xiamenensis]MCR9051590.1 hypothetical protein [bacterium]